MRGQTIECIFADAKEKHFMRYTYLQGLARLKMQTLLIFAFMNLKKTASWKRKNGLLSPVTAEISIYNCSFTEFPKDGVGIARSNTILVYNLKSLITPTLCLHTACFFIIAFVRSAGVQCQCE